MKRAEKRREQILILKTQAEEMEILWYPNIGHDLTLFICLVNFTFKHFSRLNCLQT